MKPPYKITGKILKLVASISEKIGEVNPSVSCCKYSKAWLQTTYKQRGYQPIQCLI